MDRESTEMDFLLGLAGEAIALRAGKDGYLPSSYDCPEDPEGYIISLVTALQHWCHRNGIAWQHELAQAQALFEQNLAGNDSAEKVPATVPALADLCCPKCGHAGSFVLDMRDRVFMCIEGEVGGRRAWGPFSYCECASCQYAATVAQFASHDTPTSAKTCRTK